MLVLKANILGWSLRKKNKELFPPNWFLIMNDHHHIHITSQLYVELFAVCLLFLTRNEDFFLYPRDSVYKKRWMLTLSHSGTNT